MQLAGQVRDVGLPEVFRLLTMGAKTGVLKVRRGRTWGVVHFQDGRLYYAASSVNGSPLGERLVRAGELSRSDLRSLLAEQRATGNPSLLGELIVQRGLVPEEVLQSFLQEQIEDSVFNLFSLAEADFEFVTEKAPSDRLVVALDAEAVVMECCRRLDEWRIMMQRLGSLEKVPHPARDPVGPEIRFAAEEWGVLCFVDGRRDLNTIVAESGLNRFKAARIVYGLVSRGLLVLRDPTLELLGQRLALAVRSPIDIYNLTFLATICSSEVSSHLRVEQTEDEEVEVHISAGVREDDRGGILIYSSEARTPASVVKRMALETSGFIALVNINSPDSVRASGRDLALLREIGDKPYVVATYASMVDEKLSVDDVRQILELPSSVSLMSCSLRDEEQTAAVVERLVELIP